MVAITLSRWISVERKIDPSQLDEEDSSEQEAELGALLEELVEVHVAAKFGNGT